MASPFPRPEAILEVRRIYAAPREKVFAAWTERRHLEHWMCNPEKNNVTRYLEFDLREGGKYLLEVRTPNGSRYLNKGTYEVIQPPEKLVFSWAWEKFDADGNRIGDLSNTRVTVEFLEQDQSTEVVLTHQFLPDTSTYESHQHGWIGCLEVLAQYLGV
jgi:uncharacterized protein YndB with AHSA1/START domain